MDYYDVCYGDNSRVEVVYNSLNVGVFCKVDNEQLYDNFRDQKDPPGACCCSSSRKRSLDRILELAEEEDDDDGGGDEDEDEDGDEQALYDSGLVD
jgi:hypothetical protein